MALEKITDAGDIVKWRKRGRGEQRGRREEASMQGEGLRGKGGKIQVLYARSHAAMAAVMVVREK